MIIDLSVPEDIEYHRQKQKSHLENWAKNLSSDPNKLLSQLIKLKYNLDKIRHKDDSMSRTTLVSLLEIEKVVVELFNGSSYYG